MKNIKKITRPPLRDEIYNQLKHAIITLEFQPGERIKDTDFAEQFGTSRTPVREALKRLETEGLVESLPGSLTRVTLLNEKEAKHAFTVVAALHSLATRLAVPLLDQSHISLLEKYNEQLRSSLEEKDSINAVLADDCFHDVFILASQNTEISLALERVIPKVRRLEFAKFKTLEGLSSVQQHQEIIEACKHKDVELAASLVQENWLSLGRLLTGESL
ncbi:GntR family transcriptional regulator [Lysinibacillus telephonicus]|uniref:GntR family transcriptional regulator n=1 Tax=Lysinibacillus telephonicus TaxID=1714840 RepID=A0A431UB63_9BACI|nr:GntR family transcriptional regulator [Lysinibacillus telephonicus]RTQ86416.1 GntR family transcriptional regulator [Lysinibacillus telephonicus]